MIVFGTRFFAWGSQLAATSSTCPKCRYVGAFILKQGMRFFTIYFVIPIFPVSGIVHMVQCPNCKARYKANAQVPGQQSGTQPSPFSPLD